MIQQIVKLKRFGIFQDYKASTILKNFTQYNLFYGWNGSGKSTLSKLFLSIADRKIHDHFEAGEFYISVKDQPEITNKNIGNNTLNICVFNRDFVERNVNFEESKANSILILSEEKKEEMDEYKKCLDDFKSNSFIYDERSKECNKDIEDLKKNISKWASNIKKSFELIETTNSYYLNYDRTKLNNFIRNNRSAINGQAILLQDEVRNLKNAIKPTRKDDINDGNLSSPDIQLTESLFQKLETLIGEKIFSKQINRLKTNVDINQWVQAGLNIHSEHGSENCEYCGNAISEERLRELNEHFSREYADLIEQIDKSKYEILQLKNEIQIRIPEAIELYDEFQDEYQRMKALYITSQTECEEKVLEAEQLIEKKRANPFEATDFEFSNVKTTFERYASSIAGVVAVLKKHNLKNEKFDSEVKKAQQKLELHFVSEILVSEDYESSENAIKVKQENIHNLKVYLDELSDKIRKIEAVLLNEAVGAEAFNKCLAKFIGRRDISIKFDKQLKGYRITRAGKSEAAKNLSEGEKTAIAFVYFISKLKEGTNSVDKTIILVDDPISSFDSNHLFHAYSFLKQECEKAMQLFILTHNFQYFKLLRDWLLKKNERKRKPDGRIEEKIRANFYSIDSTNEENRKSTINNASSTLLNYNSEYHFIFSKLHSFMELRTLDLEKAFMIANLSRKLLEGFLSFKFPKGRNDFSQLLQAGCSDSETREKVYRFINKYSHNERIEFHDTPIDNLIGEGDNIIESVFRIISDLDKEHYLEMEEVCNNSSITL